MFRMRGISWLSVSLADRNSSPPLEVEQVDEVVDDAAQVGVRDERVELRIDLEAGDHAQALQDGHRDRDQPDALPVVRRLAVEGDHARVNRLVEEPVVRNAGRRAVTVGDALRLQEEGLSEALGRRDDELVAPLLFEEALDPRGAVEEGGIQVVGDLDVVGINRPGTHGGFQTGRWGAECAPGPRRAV